MSSSASESTHASSSEPSSEVEAEPMSCVRAKKKPIVVAKESMSAGIVMHPPGSRTMTRDLEGQQVRDDTLGSRLNKGCLFCGGFAVIVACLPFSCCGKEGVFRASVGEGERAAKLRFGKLESVVEPGIFFKYPLVDQFKRVSIRVQTADVPQQSCLTKDNVSITVNAVIYFRVKDVSSALFEVTDWWKATTNFAQTTLRTAIGEHTLDSLFANRAEINAALTKIIDIETDVWGVKVSHVEIKDITLPKDMMRVLAAVAEATREGEAKVITAEAELRAASTLAEAADIMSTNPTALQLRYFQTLTEISADKNSTIIVPDSVLSLIGGNRGGSFNNNAGASTVDAPLDASAAFHAMISLRKEIEKERHDRLARAEGLQTTGNAGRKPS